MGNTLLSFHMDPQPCVSSDRHIAGVTCQCHAPMLGWQVVDVAGARGRQVAGRAEPVSWKKGAV